MELLFRARRKDNDKWAYGFGFIPVTIDGRKTGKYEMIITLDYDQVYGYHADYKSICIYPETVGQFTGEHFYKSHATNNGQADAYESRYKCFVGDILRIKVGGTWQTPVYVVKDLKSFYEDFRCDGVDPYYRITDAILIGNIFDNPELIK